MMSFQSFLYRFLLQGIWALASFTAIVLVAEYIVPGSVMPFIDPIPLAILSLITLAIDGAVRPVTAGWKFRLGIGLAVALPMILLLFSSNQMQSRMEIAAMIVAIGILLMIVTLFFKREPS